MRPGCRTITMERVLPQRTHAEVEVIVELMRTESTEMYLVTVYRLTRTVPYTATSDIAATLGVSLPSVSEKVKRLAEQGYMEHQWRRGVALTEEGLRIALNVIRKHRLIATFLVQQVGYLLEDVYEEACRLEHAASDQFVDRLEEMLGYPRVDPQGHPIPARDGTIALASYEPLTSAPLGQTVVIRCVNTLDQARLRYIRELGLLPHTRIQVLDIAPFEGPLMVHIGERTVALARTIAHDIEVDCEGKEVAHE